MDDFATLEEDSAIDPRLVAGKIRAARLDKGWDILKLEKESGVSRGTLYRLEKAGTEKPHFSTLCKVAEALGIPPRSLTIIFAESDLSSEHCGGTTVRLNFDRVTNPIVETAREAHPHLFADWNKREWDELYSTFGTGGALNEAGVLEASETINRKRKTVEQLECLMETHLSAVAEELIDALFQKVRMSSASVTLAHRTRLQE